MQVVVLSQVLACDATLGYEDYCNVQLLKFNGTAVNNLRHLIQLVEDCTESYMRFDLAYQVSGGTLQLYEVDCNRAGTSNLIASVLPLLQYVYAMHMWDSFQAMQQSRINLTRASFWCRGIVNMLSVCSSSNVLSTEQSGLQLLSKVSWPLHAPGSHDWLSDHDKYCLVARWGII